MTISVAVVLLKLRQIEDFRCMTNLGRRMFPDRRDRDGWLRAIAAEGHCLAYCPMPWMSDKEIVLAAVRQDGLALQYAHKNMKRDDDVRIEAVRQNPDASNYCLLKDTKWAEKFFSYGVDSLAVMGTEGAPLCTVAPFPKGSGSNEGFPYEAYWGLGGRTITGVVHRLATIGELAMAIQDQAPFKGRFCLIMPGSEEPITPVTASMSLFKYLMKQHLKSRKASSSHQEDD
jgi:hypothetical protein